MFLYRKSLAVLCLLLPFVGCSGNGDSPLVQTERALRTTVTAGAQASFPQTTTLTVSVTNTSRSAVTLGSANAAVYDVEVDDATGKRVWEYGLANITQTTQLTLAPGQTQTFTVTWLGADNQGVSLKVGKYTVKASLVPQTLNGTAVPTTPQHALSTAAAPITINSNPDAKIYVPAILSFGLTTKQDTPANRSLFLGAGSINNYNTELHNGVLGLKSGVSVEAGIAFLMTFPFMQFAECGASRVGG